MNKGIGRYVIWALAGLLAVHTHSLKGQINPSTAFYWENPYYINPAFVNMDYSAHFSLSARKQWIALSGSPTTLFGTATYFWEKYKSQAGIRIINDKIGYLNSMDLSLSYTYTLLLRNTSLNMGLSLSHQSQKLDKGEVLMDDENDPMWVEMSRDKNLWNAGIGFEYLVERSLRIGISGQNIFSFIRDKGAIFGGTTYLYGRYRTRLLGRLYRPTDYLSTTSPTTYDVEFGACLKQYGKNVQLDAVVSLYLNRNTQKEKFQLSLLGRSTGEMGVLAGVKLISELKILCSYDYNFMSLRGDTKGTFEVIITYPLYPTKCISEWTTY